MLRDLVHAGGDIDTVDEAGYTVLRYALTWNRWDIALFLIGLGADVNYELR